MKKIMIMGSAGAGKSTLAKQLGRMLELPVYHLYALFWKPGWELASREEQRHILDPIFKQDHWIIDGNYSGTIEARMQAADTIIFLDVNRWVCLYRVVKRRVIYHDRSRPDMGEGCKEKIDFAFLRYIWQFPTRKRPQIYERLACLAGEKESIVLRSSQEVEQFLERLNGVL